MPSPPRVYWSWREAQNQEVNLQFEKFHEVNRRLMVRIQTQPGFMDRLARQQVILYSELVGQGMMANLLHLTRMGKLDINLMRKIVQDPKQLSLLMDSIKVKGLSGKGSAQSHRAICTPQGCGTPPRGCGGARKC
jgi:hypothetical protein